MRTRWKLRLTPLIAADIARNLEECPKTLFVTAVDFLIEPLLPAIRKFKRYTNRLTTPIRVDENLIVFIVSTAAKRVL